MENIDTAKLQKSIPWQPNTFLEEGDAAIQEQLTFTNKEEYLAWRAEWKATYKELSAEIRTLRKQWRAEGSDHDISTHRALFSKRALARAMLTLRHASKKKAQELYLAEKEAAKVA